MQEQRKRDGRDKLLVRYHPSYEALSYEWGNPEKEHTIHLKNGTQILVTKSFDNALLDIRHEETSRVVWADGICINPDDIEERQQQVSIMGTIYSKASQVLTYIGLEEDRSSIAIYFANGLLRKYESVTIGGGPSADDSTSLRLPPGPDPRYSALKRLILRGWSSRSCCSQEFVLNKNLIMLCGWTMDWFLAPAKVQLILKSRRDHGNLRGFRPYSIVLNYRPS
ncbi:heterokaryon incompatibility protein-domain-containing protein [Halenospora varia]|nr:heterokaryon incompatibility protein-domain-containing protein [Halenospora varia]